MPQLTQPEGHTFLNPTEVLKQVGLKVGQWVADLGCGGGYFVLPAARMVGDEGRVYGVDVLKTALSSLGSKVRLYNLTNVQLVWGNVEVYGGSKGIQDHSVDVVLLVQLLSQTAKRKEALKEADRIAKHNGQLVVVDWKSDSLSFSPIKKNYIAPDEVKSLASASYLKFDREIEVGPYHYCLIFNKG